MLHSPKKTKPSLDMSARLLPLINIIFLLLIFFMLTSPLSVTHQHTLALPRAEKKESLATNAINIELEPSGHVKIEEDEVAMEDVKTVITTLLHQRPNAALTILSDRELPASKIVELLETLEKTGAQSVRIATENNAPTPVPSF